MRWGWIALLSVACSHLGPGPAPWLPGFDESGRLLLVLEREDVRELWVLDASGSRRVDVEAPVEARWIDPERLLVVHEVPPAEEFGLPERRLVLRSLAGEAAPLATDGQPYDPEPSPDGRWLAVGVEAAGVGDSDLEIWSLDDRERLARRSQSFEEPRWRHDGRALVGSVLMADPETDEGEGGGMLGTSFTWPRMHRLRMDLGEPTFLWDGTEGRALAPGGSLPLWWDDAGIVARQRDGLVRCDPMAGGCTVLHATPGARRIVDGRPVGAEHAWLLTVRAEDAFDRRQPDEIRRIDLASGELLDRWQAPEGVGWLDIDWIATE